MSTSRPRRGLAALSAALLTATTAGAALADVTILAWPGGSAEKAMRAVVAAYNETQGVEDGSTAELLFFSRQGFLDKMLADLAAGSTEFDINLTTTYGVGRYAPFMDPLDDLFGEELYEVFPENVLATQSFDGKLYGIPNDLSLHFVYYRTDLFDQLLSDEAWQARFREIAQEHLGEARDPKLPDEWDWNDYIATALFFTKSINSDSPTRYGTVLQLKNLIFNIMLWQSTVASHGGDWHDAEGNITVDSEAYRQGLQIFKTIIDAGATPGSSTSFEYAEANAAFGSGQVAFMTQWNAAVPELSDPEQHPVVAGKFQVTHQPKGPAGIKTHFHSLGLGLNAASENKEDARKFLQWLATEETMVLYTEEGGAPPAPKILELLADERPDMPLMGQHAAEYGFVMNGGTAATAINVYELMAEQFTAYWSDQVDIDTALANVEAGMAKIEEGN